jgi:ABC-type Fe3+/spermidine/putrescine transport system ATPase subunit
MSDRIAVMNQGRVEQLDAPEALYERPRTRFVADFLAVKNILEATVESVADGRATLRTRGGNRVVAADDGGYVAGAVVVIGVRPERLALEGPGKARGQANAFAGTLDDEIYLGDWTDWRVRLGEERLSVSEGATSARHRKRGDEVTVRVPPDAVLRLEDVGSAAARA